RRHPSMEPATGRAGRGLHLSDDGRAGQFRHPWCGADMNRFFSWSRFMAVLLKEFIQMRRDRVTFAMMIGLPIIQLLLFGFAINADPRHLPTLVEMGDDGPLVRAILSGMEVSEYFDFRGTVEGVGAGEAALRRGDANFVVVIPDGFERDVVRGLRPEILISADASDPAAVGGAVGAMNGII